MRVKNWQDLTQAVEADTKDKTAPTLDVTISENGSEKQVTVTPEENQGRYILGVQPESSQTFYPCLLVDLQLLLTQDFASFRLWKTWFSIQIWTNSVVPLLFLRQVAMLLKMVLRMSSTS